MPRIRKVTASAFAALRNEGGLIAPAVLTRIATLSDDEQTRTDYGIFKGLTLRDEIARYFRIGQALFADLDASATPSATATVTFTRDLMRDVFCFADIRPGGTRLHGGRSFAVTLEAGDGRIPIVVAPPTDELDRPSPHLSGGGARRSAASTIQDWLNAGDEALWGFCCNGERLRLLRDNASLTRPAFIEANLRQIFEAEDFADFTALWLLIHASRFGQPGTPPGACALEQWRETGAREGMAARDRLRDGVEEALLILGNGFLAHPRNDALRRFLAEGRLPRSAFFEEILRLVYRLIFLLVAEDRGLLHPREAALEARRLYAEGYSLAALRAHAIRRSAWDRYHDRWEGLLVTFAALARGEPKLGLPALGGLFTREMIPDLEAATLPNRALMEAIYRLCWLKEAAGLVAVNWRDMETEELGSVYESLLELTPVLVDGGRRFVFAEGAEAKGNARKTTGSYYTPDSLVQTLLDETLDPVLDRFAAEADNPADALLRVTVIDPACGSGHFLLAAARRIATRVARARADGAASDDDYRHALRDVVRTCIYGVDRNPMAVELSKVALWIEALEPGRPLTFLDNHIRCGDSLVGVFDYEMLRKGLPDEAFDPLTGDDKDVAKAYAALNRRQRTDDVATGFLAELRMPAEVSSGAEALLAMPEETLAEIEAKAEAFRRLVSGATWWKLKTACDMYVAAFFTPKQHRQNNDGKLEALPGARTLATLPVPTTEAIVRVLQGGDLRGDVQAAAIDIAGRNDAFHWPLEFPAIMAKGGFDVVIGNPPWERIKLQEQEFFATRDPEIATAPNKAERDKLIKALKAAEPGSARAALSDAFEQAKRDAEAASIFIRKSGRFPLTGTGDVNTYALFAEHFARLARTRTDGAVLGRAGVIVPTGIATDSSTSKFFGNLVEGSRLAALISFNEVRKWFKATDERKSFCILSIGLSNRAIPLFCEIDDIHELHNEEQKILLISEDFRLFNPNTLTAPLFRARYDHELTRKLYQAAPVLIRNRPKHSDGDENPWGITFQRLFDMATDSLFFHTAEQLTTQGLHRDGPDWRHEDGRHYVPLFEAKMIHHFDHRFGSYAGLNARPGDGSLPETPDSMKASPDYEADPWYWVPEDETRLRVARVPTRLKQKFRKEDGSGCLKMLAEWVLGTLDPEDLVNPARGAGRIEARLREVLGVQVLERAVIGARLPTWLGKDKTISNAREMQRETSLSAEDLRFIQDGPSDPLELTRHLIDRKQPRWLMGWRDVCRSTDERTLIVAAFPKTGVNHKLQLFFSDAGTNALSALLANFTSLAFDYVSRQKFGGTSMAYFYLRQFPVLAPHQFTPADLAFITPRVLELTYTSHSMRSWAEDLRHTGAPFPFDPERRALLRAELDAFFARKYNLTKDELRYILDPADVKGSSYPSETFRGLKRNEEQAFGEYRTARLVLAAYDRLTTGALVAG